MEPTSTNLTEEVQEVPPPGSDRNRNVKPARELKVEDALLYLDQVKMEFSDKPQIYNEFLDIMKNFKSQSINTPGVIERVKNLFKGYNKLILGFNTFLPEGEGYKIELTPEEQAFNHPGHEAPSAALSTPSRMMSGWTIGPDGQKIGVPAANNDWPANINGMHSFAPAHPPVQHAAPPVAPQQMQQAHAIHYVTKIRNRFSTEPDTYRQFLKILHTYQKEQKGIKEVLEQVSQLFSEHPDLLMEFTYFLPDAVQDQAKERLHRAARESEARKHARAIAQKQKNKQTNMLASMNANVGMLNAANAANRALGRVGGSSNDLLMAPVGLGGQRGGGKRMVMDMMTGGMGADSLSQLSDKEQMLAQREKLLNSLPAKKKAKLEAPGGPLYNPNRGGMMMDDDDMPQEGKKQRRNMKGGQQHDINSTDLRVNGGKLSANALLASNLNFRSNKESHISMSAERKFFDTVKEVLISSNRENWTEFVKCLELFANDSIGRNELFELVSDLLTTNGGQGTGSTGNELMLEFKRLMSNRTDYVANKEDVWFAVPLSEVDFSQCRKCTPSYRALPRDYPKPKCTERSEEECTVLNDQWVSIPIGSEESYAFKHMRKNQYEEQLFKIEDDRFEIDMIIDSNMNTIRVLEPLAEELVQFKSVDPIHADGNPVSGLTPRFSFQLEPRHLSTINLNAISRIYGETHGEEILELLRKNPAAAIPVILKRLRQKDVEWRAARVELNNTWKEIVSTNHFKSFDHRSFYFRQSDKKYLSTRQMVNEIVGVPPVGSVGINSTASVISTNTAITNAQNAELVKSAEEAVIAGIASAIDEANASTLSGLKPQLLLNYANGDHQVHRDIYKIMCHAAETHLTNSQDKEKLAALWRDLLRVFFNIPPHYLYSQNPNDNAQNSVPAPIFLHPSEAWLPNTRIITLYGSGVVKSFRAKDSMYEVQLPFGVAFLNPNVIYGAEELSKQALNAIGVTADPDTGADKIYNGLVTSSLENPQETVKDPSKLFYGTQMCYIFLRLHHTLYTRLSLAHKLAVETAEHQAYLEDSAAGSNNKQFTSNYNNSTLLQFMDAPDTEAHMLNGDAAPTAKSRPVYNQFFGHLLSLVEGNIDNAKFEDITRSLLGNKSYMLYTLDKIISQGIKHLQAMANDENVNKLVGLFVYHHYKATTGTKTGIDPTLYQNHVSHILSHTMEDVYRIQLLTRSAGVAQGMSQVGIQHLGILNPNDIASLQNNSNANSTSNLSQMDVSTTGGGAAGDLHHSTLLSPHNLKSASRDSALSPRVGDESRAPKAVVSDGEDDEDDDQDDEGTANNDNEDAPPSPPKSSMYSPRTRQFMS